MGRFRGWFPSMRVLKRAWQFRQVYRDGRKIECAYAIVFYRRSDDVTGGPFVGVVASRRIGGAIERNRAKRRLREVGRSLVGSMSEDDLWVVLVARSGILNASHRALVEDLRSKLTAEGLVRPG